MSYHSGINNCKIIKQKHIFRGNNADNKILQVNLLHPIQENKLTYDKLMQKQTHLHRPPLHKKPFQRPRRLKT